MRMPLARAGVEGKLSRKGIPEIVQVFDEGVVSQDPFQGADQGGVIEPGHTPVEPVGDPGVVSLAEFEAERRMDDRIEQPRHDFPLVVHDVAVMQGDGIDILIRKDISERHPDGPALSRVFQIEFRIHQLLLERLHPRPVMPNHPHLHRQNRHDLPDLVELRFIRPIQGENDPVEIIHPLELFDDPGHRRAIEFRHKGRQKEDHFTLPRNRFELPFDILDRSFPQLLQGRNDPVLAKISHSYSSFPSQSSIR